MTHSCIWAVGTHSQKLKPSFSGLSFLGVPSALSSPGCPGPPLAFSGESGLGHVRKETGLERVLKALLLCVSPARGHQLR